MVMWFSATGVVRRNKTGEALGEAQCGGAAVRKQQTPKYSGLTTGQGVNIRTQSLVKDL
jgi:hypothetical protein